MAALSSKVPIRPAFTGRRAEPRKLSDWVAGGPPLAVVTGSPGAGKSALLGVVVAVLHPDLAPVADTVRERVGADLLPRGGVPMAALHACGRAPGQLIASIAAQLRLPAPHDGWTRAALLAALLSEYADGTPPLIICDALDESADPAEVTQLLISLTDLVRPDTGGPVVRVLVGTRPWEEFDPHARIRARGERAVATLKTWKVLTKLHCCPSRTTTIVQAILVLHHVENPTYRG